MRITSDLYKPSVHFLFFCSEVVKVIVIELKEIDETKEKEKVGGKNVFLRLLKANRHGILKLVSVTIIFVTYNYTHTHTLSDIAKHIMDNCIDVEEDDRRKMRFHYSFLLEKPSIVNRKTRSQRDYESIEERYT